MKLPSKYSGRWRSSPTTTRQTPFQPDSRGHRKDSYLWQTVMPCSCRPRSAHEPYFTLTPEVASVLYGNFDGIALPILVHPIVIRVVHSRNLPDVPSQEIQIVGVRAGCLGNRMVAFVN